jgi:hypothetical protein
LNPSVTQQTIGSTICVSGWSESVRPPEDITEQEKVASMAAYGDAGAPDRYEYDHLVSLELGGATNDPRNLWPEPGASPNPKDDVENALHVKVCEGQVTLREAQRLIATSWVRLARSQAISASPPRTTRASPSPTGETHRSTGRAIVHPGAYCSPPGARGVTAAGTAMTCKRSVSDDRDRWRRS